MRVQRDTMLGLVFFGGLVLVGWATVNLTRLSFEPRPTLEVWFPDALGLRQGDEVYLLGTRIGEVRAVELVPDRRPEPVRVEIELERAVELRQDARFEIRQSSLLGGVEVGIEPGSAEAEGTAPFRGVSRLGAVEKLGEADLAGAVESIQRFFDRLTEPDNTVGALLESRAPFEDLAATLESTRRIVEAIESGRGPLGMAVYDQQVANDLSAAVADLRLIMRQAAHGEGALPRLLNDAALGRDLAATLADVRELMRRTRAGEGALGRLTSDEELADQLAEIVESLRSVARKLDDPEAGLVGAAVGDARLREAFVEIAENLAAVTQRIEKGEGLLGRLVSDPALADRFERLFAQISGAVEEAREAAPVGTFIQVLAAPF